MKMDVNSLSQHVKVLWNEYQLNTLILLSLCLQMFLVVFGKRQKRVVAKWLRYSVWLAYLSADWVATYTLGVLARSQGESDNKNGATPNSDLIVPAFWAPILLVHLGGPDTITAYSVEDNELWLRHMLELVTQVVIAFYALLRSWWSKDTLVLVAIPIFIAGIIKYGERNWLLRLARSENLRASASGEMEHTTLRNRLSQFTHVDFFRMTSTESLNQNLGFNTIISQAKFLHEAYLFFEMSKVLIVGHVLQDFEHLASYLMLKEKSAADAFKLIAVELGFMFDVLYTKLTRIQYSRLIFRAISFLCAVSGLLAFSISVNRINRPYSTSNLTISYLLLVGGVVLDIYAAVVVVLSDWGMLWLSKQGNPIANSIYRIICLFSGNQKRWIDSFAQHNLLTAQIIDQGRKENVFTRLLGNGHIQSWEDKGNDLEELIFKELLDKRSRYSLLMLRHDPGKSDLTKILAERGGQVFEREECPVDLNWSVTHSDFNQSILAWHIATDLCYYDDFYKKWNRDADRVHPSCKMSRALSNYMLYLSCDYPSFLPAGKMDEVRYKRTCSSVSDRYHYFDIIINGQIFCWNSDSAIESISATTRHPKATREFPARRVIAVTRVGSWLGQQSEMGYD